MNFDGRHATAQIMPAVEHAKLGTAVRDHG